MKKSVLILQNIIPHYRKALYNLLANDYNLTIIHSGASTVISSDKYKEIILPVRKYGPLNYQKGLLNEVYNGYDIVIAMCDLHWPLNFFGLFYRPQKNKYILWGAWLTNKYFIDTLKFFLAKRADANIFYCTRDKENFLKANVPEKKLFIANNTFDVGRRNESFLNKEKFRIVFVGTLETRKDNESLIYAFNNIKRQISSNVKLSIIGEGATKRKLETLVDDLKLSDRVIFEGKITDTNILLSYYAEAIVAVSYGQAGLSALQSLGFGVPFITKKDAISGGEITNIIDGYNGYLCDGTLSDLEKKLLELCDNIDKAREMGKNAFDYYSRYCTIENMAKGFKAAIDSEHKKT